MDLTRAIKRWAEPAVRPRATGGSYVDGAWVPGADATASISGMFEPSAGNMRNEAPAGVIEEADWLLWSLDEIKHDDVVQRTADGVLYRAIWVKDYSHLASYWLAALNLESTG